MTLYINGRFLTQPMSGVQRYAHGLVQAFDNLLMRRSDLRDLFGPVVMLGPFYSGHDRADYPKYQAIEVSPLGAARGHVWEQSTLYRASRDGVLLSLGNSGPLAHPAQVIAFHDAHVFEMPDSFAKQYRRWHQFLRPRLAHRAAGLVTVSRFSAQSLGKWLGVDPGRFHIVPNAAEHFLTVPENHEAVAKYELQRGAYFLSVGNQSPNKNLGTLAAAHAAAGPGVPELVIVGDAPRALCSVTHEQQSHVRYLGRVSDSDLHGLFRGSAGFVFPSLHEGFGIPPLEAMQLGVPVLSSATSAMPEILGDAPMWFDPRDQAGLTEQLRWFAGMEPSERKRRIDLGLAQAARYSWQSSAEVLADCLRDVFVQDGMFEQTPLKARVSGR